MNESVAMLGVLAAAAWAVFGCLYARMSWSGGAPDRDSWRFSRTVLLGVAAASLATVIVTRLGSVHIHPAVSAAMGFGLVIGVVGVITGQIRRRLQMRSTTHLTTQV